MDKNTILKISDNVVKRFEYGINVFYLLNFLNNEIWTGNEASKLFISLLDGKKSINDLLLILKNYFEDYSEEELFDSIETIFLELLDKNFIKIVT